MSHQIIEFNNFKENQREDVKNMHSAHVTIADAIHEYGTTDKIKKGGYYDNGNGLRGASFFMGGSLNPMEDRNVHIAKTVGIAGEYGDIVDLLASAMVDHEGIASMILDAAGAYVAYRERMADEAAAKKVVMKLKKADDDVVVEDDNELKAGGQI